MIGIAALFAVNLAFTESFNPTQTVDIFIIYFNLIISFEILFIFMFFFYGTGGLGIVGSLFEKSSEMIEDANLFSDLKKHTTPKAFISYLIYGYVFVFGIFAGNKVLMILLGMEYKIAFLWFEEIFITLQFESTLIIILGITLFSIKAFKHGYFSKEYWKSNLTYDERRSTWYRYLRKFIVVFLYSWGIYTAFISYFIEIFGLSTPFEYGGIDSLLLVFYLAALLQSIYFFKNKTEVVSPLKTQQDDFKKKVDETIQIAEVKPKKPIEEEQDEIKFE
ncbi:MAG: hypothetical protein GF364_12250 [Candidatus Lokiarchaeota archaeon]|nr:hypothetical protein [Candidatus Lokiarchaeota archaeon]